MSIRSFLSRLISPDAETNAPIAETPPASFDRGVTFGVGTVRQAAVSPDGERVAVATSLGVAVFDAKARAREMWFQPTERWASSVAFSANGARVIAGTAAGQARIYDAASGDPIATLDDLDDTRTHVALDADGRRALIGQRVASLWDVDSRAMLRALDGTSQEITAVAFHPDGARVAAVDYAGHLLVWDSDTGRELARWRPGDQPLRALAFSPDGSLIAAVGKQWTVWELGLAVQVQSQDGPGPMLSVALSPDGERLITTARTRALVWDVATGERLREIRAHIDDVHSVAFAREGDAVLLASQKLHWASSDTGEFFGTLAAFARARRVAFSDDDALVAIADKQVITVWERETGEVRAVLDGHTHAIGQLRFAGGDVVSHSPREVIGWDLSESAARWVVRGAQDGHVGGAGPAPDQRVIAAVETEPGHYTLGAWQSGELVHTLARVPRTLRGIDALEVSPDGRYVAARVKARITRWDVASGAERLTIDEVATGELCCAWTGDATLAVAMADGRIALWHAERGRSVGALAHDGALAGIAVSPDGALVIGHVKRPARSGDQVVAWDARARDRIGELDIGGTCHALAISPDNATLVAGFSDLAQRASGGWSAWHLATGALITRHTGPAIWAAGFSRDGATLVTASGDGRATAWAVRRGSLL